MIELPLGLPGFPGQRHFVLLDHKPGSVFRWLHAMDDPGLAFVVIDPLAFKPDFPVDAVRNAAGFVGLEEQEELIILVICTVPPAPAQPTANFLAPIGIGRQTRRGAQVVLHETGFGSAEKFLSR